MKILLYALFIILVTTSCSNETEKIIATHPGGEKKVVAYYKGKDVDEQLVKRLTYDETGELILKEDLLKNERLDYMQLHPELKTTSGLEEYLQGKWKCKYTYHGWIFDREEEGNTEVSGSTLTYSLDYYGGGNGTAKITYRPLGVIALVDIKHEYLATNGSALSIKSKRTFTYYGAKGPIEFNRDKDLNVVEILVGIVLLVVALIFIVIFAAVAALPTI